MSGTGIVIWKCASHDAAIIARFDNLKLLAIHELSSGILGGGDPQVGDLVEIGDEHGPEPYPTLRHLGPSSVLNPGGWILDCAAKFSSVNDLADCELLDELILGEIRDAAPTDRAGSRRKKPR